MDELGAALDSNLRLHTKAPLLPHPRLMYLRLSLPLPVFGRIGCSGNRGIHNGGAGADLEPYLSPPTHLERADHMFLIYPRQKRYCNKAPRDRLCVLVSITSSGLAKPLNCLKKVIDVGLFKLAFCPHGFYKRFGHFPNRIFFLTFPDLLDPI